MWLHLRFTLSHQDVEDLSDERGTDIFYETVRRWVLKFGPAKHLLRGQAVMAPISSSAPRREGYQFALPADAAGCRLWAGCGPPRR